MLQERANGLVTMGPYLKLVRHLFFFGCLVDKPKLGNTWIVSGDGKRLSSDFDNGHCSCHQESDGITQVSHEL